ncbi:glycine--tRNA ligase subunit beta [Sphingomonas sp. DT-204]|uniref:glycine--tRNA ligase subunit beta n=1 Tax=Sphingomonas sp. DT-204 TaxID=3396166 RepID=UPI003F1D9A1F
MTDFLLELRSEEIPARMQEKAREDIARLFAAELAKSGLAAAETVTYATPRRLALIARGLPDETAAVSEEIKGPRANAPEQALEGFLRKTGLRRDQLVERDGVLFAIIDKPGRATAEVLAEAIPAIVRAFPWPKSMRWGIASLSTESLRWVRPLQGIVALLGGELVPCEVAGIASGAATVGHRFHHPGEITIGSAADYVEKLRTAHVIADGAERRAIIAEGARKAAAAAGLTLIEDEGLLYENAGLTEWPVPLLGRFDEDFLSVPPEVIQLTARVNQKYFVCQDAAGKLANAFVCVANIDATDGGAKIVEGNRKVLAARLSDARFFYETDLKTPLEEQAKKLDKIVFHEKLGTVADKVDRVAKLARWLVEEGIVREKPSPLRGEGLGEGRSLIETAARGTPPLPTLSPEGRGLADMAERAARLAKADLVTGMVGEFPELQGLIGGYYAAAQGEPREVAEAIRDHYKPVGQGDDVPTAPVTVAVSLADKLDTIASFFAIGEKPTGSKDPFALRRAALGIGQLVIENGIRLRLIKALTAQAGITDGQAQTLIENGVMQAMRPHLLKTADAIDAFVREWPETIKAISNSAQLFAENWTKAITGMAESVNFFADRLKVQQREAGVRHDLIDAVFALGGEDDLVRLLARVRALQSFIATEDGANLLTGYRRAANILKKESYAGHEEKPLSYTPEPAEKALIEALDSAEPKAKAAVEGEDFEGAMAALATLRAPIDAFFDSVTVNDTDEDKRAARLALLARMRDAVHAVADFSRIEG